MPTKTYAEFISEQQAKLRGAGLLDESRTHTTISWHVPVYQEPKKPKPDNDYSIPPSGNQDDLDERHDMSKHISAHATKNYGARDVSSKSSNYKGYKTTKYSITVPNEHAEKIKNHLLDADLTNESGGSNV